MADRTLARQPGTTPLRIYKPGQGIHVRWGTAFGAALIVVAGAIFLHEQLRLPFGGNTTLDVTSRTLIPVAVVVALAYAIFLMVGKRRGPVDFMIATEGEMKKVNWSTRKEVMGATKVVIFTVFTMGLMLFIVDIFFMIFFATINVLKIPIWERWFGTGTEL